MVAIVTAGSQQYRLREEFERSHIRHDETLRVDIPNVRVTAGANGAHEATIHFDEIEPLRIRRRLTSGDDAPLPAGIVVEGLNVPEPGEYDLMDALVRCNGDVRIIADSRTHVRVHEDSFAARVLRQLSVATW